MSPTREENRQQVRHLYFVARMSPAQIAEHLRLSPLTVRRALVLLGGARRSPPIGLPPGPYRLESES